MNTLSHSLQSQCSPFEDQAAALLEVNLSPIPITPGEQKPAVDEWQSFADKLPPEVMIKLWQKKFPDAGVGMPLGKSLGYSKGPYIVAIDIDQNRYVEPVTGNTLSSPCA